MAKQNTIRTFVEQALTGSPVMRAALFSRLGMQYGTDRDLYQALGYPTQLKYIDFRVKYKRQDIAKAVIDRPVSATWKGGFQLFESDDDQETALEKEFKVLYKRLKISLIFKRLDKLVGLGEFGILLLGLDDVRTREDFAKPVNIGKRKLLYLTPFGQGNADIDSFDMNPTSERYNLPEFYDLKVSKTENSDETLRVHHSRVLHITDNPLESSLYGTPRLEPIYNRLMDIEKLTGGSAEMFWRGARPGYHGKVDPEYTMTDTVREDLKDQIDEYEHQLRRILVTEGIDLQALAAQVSSPKDHLDVQIQMISAQTGIPKRILTGSELGELASSQDRDNWFSYIGQRREDIGEEAIIYPFVNKLMDLKILPVPTNKDDDEDYSVKWAPLNEESDKDKAEVGRIRASALKEYTSSPMAEMVVPHKAFFEYFLGLDEAQIEYIQELQEAAMAEEELLDDNDLDSNGEVE